MNIKTILGVSILLLVSGQVNVAPLILYDNNLFYFEVTGLDLALSADTVYWLGINNNDVFTTAAQVEPVGSPLIKAIQSDGLITYNM